MNEPKLATASTEEWSAYYHYQLKQQRARNAVLEAQRDELAAALRQGLFILRDHSWIEHRAQLVATVTELLDFVKAAEAALAKVKGG